jgi:hypothetical protein
MDIQSSILAYKYGHDRLEGEGRAMALERARLEERIEAYRNYVWRLFYPYSAMCCSV